MEKPTTKETPNSRDEHDPKKKLLKSWSSSNKNIQRNKKYSIKNPSEMRCQRNEIEMASNILRYKFLEKWTCPHHEHPFSPPGVWVTSWSIFISFLV